MNYTFTAIVIILLCLLTLWAAPIQNPSLKNKSKDYILPQPKPIAEKAECNAID
tara:strand:+ start:1893 stop:2054 length:162 start_codon:yes stop_codon:yes gene_type:complete